MIITHGCEVTPVTHLVVNVLLCWLRFEPPFFYIRLLVTLTMGCLDLRLQAGIYNMTTGSRLHIGHSCDACNEAMRAIVRDTKECIIIIIIIYHYCYYYILRSGCCTRSYSGLYIPDPRARHRLNGWRHESRHSHAIDTDIYKSVYVCMCCLASD